MINKIFKIVVIAVICSTGVYNTTAEGVDLKKTIDEKAKELEAINGQIQETQDNLGKLATQKQSLNKELKKIDYTLNQVSLSIKSSEINISKLQLELQSLSGKVEEVERNVDIKKAAIMESLEKIHRADKSGILEIMLRNESLVEGAFEVQALKEIQNVLSADVDSLKTLHSTIIETIEETSSKKKQVEVESKNLKNRKNIAEDQKLERKNLLSTTKNKEQVYQQQLTELEKKQDEVAKEIEKLEFELRGRIDATQIPGYRAGTIAFPVPGGKITQGYGRTSFAVSNYRGKHHNGIDIGKFLGAEVVSAEDGKVVAVGDQDKFCRRAAYGKFIVVRHHNGLTTLYGHLAGQTVAVGQEVQRGQVIGYMGKTGWATGPHLHFVVYDSSTYSLKSTASCGPMPIGGDIDPNKYI